MDNNTFLKININLSDLDKSLINEFEGKKYLCCEVHTRKTKDAYGNTHTVSIRVKNPDGTFRSEYIGKGKECTFGKQAPQPAAPIPAPIPEPTTLAGTESQGDDLPF